MKYYLNGWGHHLPKNKLQTELIKCHQDERRMLFHNETELANYLAMVKERSETVTARHPRCKPEEYRKRDYLQNNDNISVYVGYDFLSGNVERVLHELPNQKMT